MKGMPAYERGSDEKNTPGVGREEKGLDNFFLFWYKFFILH
jgi:hypothetical protein